MTQVVRTEVGIKQKNDLDPGSLCRNESRSWQGWCYSKDSKNAISWNTWSSHLGQISCKKQTEGPAMTVTVACVLTFLAEEKGRRTWQVPQNQVNIDLDTQWLQYEGGHRENSQKMCWKIWFRIKKLKRPEANKLLRSLTYVSSILVTESIRRHWVGQTLNNISWGCFVCFFMELTMSK